jgi:hypothetical protein
MSKSQDNCCVILLLVFTSHVQLPTYLLTYHTIVVFCFTFGSCIPCPTHHIIVMFFYFWFLHPMSNSPHNCCVLFYFWFLHPMSNSQDNCCVLFYFFLHIHFFLLQQIYRLRITVHKTNKTMTPAKHPLTIAYTIKG